MVLACKCGNSGGSVSDGFADGHQLKGRYSNSSQGIQSFTFQTDGTFVRAGGSAGTTSGGSGEYGAGSTLPGTYRVGGNNISLKYENGKNENLSIEVPSVSNHPDYSLESPTQLKIGGAVYTNVD